MPSLRPVPSTIRLLFVVASIAGALSACASMGTGLEPPDVWLIGLEPLPAEGNLEQRLRLQLRVANPNDEALAFDGVSLTLDLNGQRLGRALGNERVTIPRLADDVIELTATTHVFAIVRQVMTLPQKEGIDYEVRGRVFLADSPGWLRVSRKGRLADLSGVGDSRF